MRIAPILAALAFATPALSQDFDLDFDSFEFDDTEFVAEETRLNNLKVSASVGLSYSGVGDLDESWAAQVNLANQHQLGSLGYLEWATAAVIKTESTFDILRIHLQNSAGDFSWKLGKYSIGWGEIEGAPVLDVLNSGLSFGGSGLAGGEPAGQWFLGLDYFGSATTLSSFIGVMPEVAHVVDTAPSADTEVGVKADIPVESGAVSLYAAQLVPQSGVVDLDSGKSNAKPYALAGISANRSFGNLLIEVDVAGKFGLQRSTIAGLSEHNRVDAALGVEYAASNTMQVSASVTGQQWVEQTEVYLLPGGYESPQTSANYMFGISKYVLDGKLNFSVNILESLDSSLNAKALSASYFYSNRLEFGASAMWLSAESGAPFESLDGFTQYGLTSTFRF
ncbi:MAG: hypothetical protein ABGW81_04385 [Paracoccaceae bacterium]